MGTVPAILTKHARARCAEMGIPPRVPQEIVAHPSLTRPDGRGNRIAMSTLHPEYAVAFTTDPRGVPVIITVIFNTREFYTRAGSTFIAKPPEETDQATKDA